MSLDVKYTLFATLAKGGYMRTFVSVSHPGIGGVISRETRKHGEVRKFFIEGDNREFTTTKDVLQAYSERRRFHEVKDK